jgi:hypothetical protein
VCVRQLPDCHDMTSYFWRPPKHRKFQFPAISNNNMADTRICEAVTTEAKQILTACGHLLLLSIYFKRYLTATWNRQFINKCWICYIAIRDIAAAIYIYIYIYLCQVTHMNISIHFVWPAAAGQITTLKELTDRNQNNRFRKDCL